MIEISYSWFFIFVVLLLIIFAFWGASDRHSIELFNESVETIRKDISGLHSQLSSDITKTVSYYHNKNAEIKQLSQIIDRMEAAAEKIDKAAERMDRASKTIIRSSNKIANSSSILTMIKTIEKL